MREDHVWQSPGVVRGFLSGVRAAIPLAEQQIDVMLRLLRAARPLKRFLDLGCGDGVLAGSILSEYPDATAVCVDFSEPMLDAARARLPHSARLIPLDYADPAWMRAMQPFAPFDAIVSGFSIHHQPDVRKRAIYVECYTLLAPGALFLNLEHVASATEWGKQAHDDLFIDHIHALDPSSSRETTAQAYHARPDKLANILAPVEVQLQWLREIGFEDVDCFLKVFELALFGGRRASR